LHEIEGEKDLPCADMQRKGRTTLPGSWSWSRDGCVNISGPAEPRLLLPLHEQVRHPGQQFRQAILASIGYAGEHNASLQDELGA
jgi:hypothetical protein